MLLCGRLLLCFVVLCLSQQALIASEVDGHVNAQLNGLVEGTISAAESVSILRNLKGNDRLLFMALMLEVQETPEKRIAYLLPLLHNRRELAAKVSEAVCSLADALITSGDVVQAEQILALLPSLRSVLVQADVYTVEMALALQRRDFDGATNLSRSARHALKRAVPDLAYANWHSRLLERRLKRLERKLSDARAEDLGGPAYLAWIRAEQDRRTESYQALIDTFSETLFASAARLILAQRGQDKGAKICLEYLNQQRQEFQGPLADQFYMLAGDAYVMLGNLKDARAHYSKALKASARPNASLLKDLPVALRSKLLPREPLHRKDKWNYPIWETRATGHILASALSSEIAAFHRYKIIVRQSSLYYLSGKANMAGQLARMLLSIDPIDQHMAEEKDGAGGMCLQETFSKGEFIIPLDNVDKLPAGSRACFIIGVAFYRVYDWNSAGIWVRRALNLMDAGERRGRVASHALLACIEQMRHNFKQALVHAKQTQLERGDRPHQAWFIARQVEWEIYQRSSGDYKSVMDVFNHIREVAAGTLFAQKALLYQATYTSNRGPRLAKQLFELFRKKYPGIYDEAVSYHLTGINAALKLQKSELTP